MELPPPPTEELPGTVDLADRPSRNGGDGRGGRFDRVPPHSLEAEVAVLGAAMQNPLALPEVLQQLTADDFYRTAHRTVFEAIYDLNATGNPVDQVTVLEWLRARHRLDEIGGPVALVELTEAMPTAANAVYYAGIVREKALLRRLIEAGTEVVRMGYEEGDDVKATVDRAESIVFGVADAGTTNDVRVVNDLLRETFEQIEELAERQSEVTGLATGFDDLDRLTAGLQPQNLVIIAARPAMGKCLNASAQLVDASSGRRTTIGELVEDRLAQEEFGVASLGADHRLAPTRPVDFIDNGIAEVFRVTTRLGREVVATANHPLRTWDGWTAVEDLRPGTRIAVPRRLDVFGDKRLPQEEAALLGYLLGDGGLTGTTPQFTTASPAILDDVTGWAQSYGASVSVVQQGSIWQVALTAPTSVTHADVALRAGVSEATVSLSLSGSGRVATTTMERVHEAADTMGYVGRAANPVTQMCRRHGIWGLGSHDKFVPEAIFTAPKEDVRLFLSRLYATDGSAWTSGERRIQGISYSTVSKGLARDVQHLLLRFGVNAKLGTRSIAYAGTRRTAYEIDIRGADDILTFADEIGIFSKEEQLADVVAAVESRGRHHTNVDLIPEGVWDWILEDKGDRSWADVSEATGRSRNHNWHVGRRAPSRRLVGELAEVLDSERLRQVATSDLWWDEVVAIEPAGTDRVFDLEIPELHNFVADDIVVHNSSLTLNMAHYVTTKLHEPVLCFNLEMSANEIVQRLLSQEAGIPSNRLRTGQLDEHDWGKLSDALGVLSQAPLYIDDTPSISVMDIRAKARRIKQTRGLSLVIVDYLQLMQGRGRADSRQQEVAEISRGLKMLAKELDVPVIALSQLSRQPEARTDKRPMLADLRESGSIEQDADIVGFIYRDEVYHEDTEEAGIAELIIAKHRNGSTRTIKLAFLNHLTKFANLARGGL